MGSGCTKFDNIQNKYNINDIDYYKNNFKKEFSGDIRNIKRYFLFKALSENKIDINRTYFSGRLVYKS